MSQRDKLDHEPDRVPLLPLVRIAVAALVVFGVGGAWAVTVQRAATGSVRSGVTGPSPEYAGQPEVGMVYQQPFDHSIAAAKNELARQRLESTGWVDRDAGVVHVPIEQAMDLVVKQGRL